MAGWEEPTPTEGKKRMGSHVWRQTDSLRLVSSGDSHPFGAIDYPRLPAKPRATAVSSVLDGGLGPAEARDRVAVAGEWIDVVKLGWATARLTPAATLREKIDIYRSADIHVCSGGTFLEIALAQNRVREFLDGARDLGLTMVEVSNGVHPMSEKDKLGTHRAARARPGSPCGARWARRIRTRTPASASTTVARRSRASSRPGRTR